MTPILAPLTQRTCMSKVPEHSEDSISTSIIAGHTRLRPSKFCLMQLLELIIKTSVAQLPPLASFTTVMATNPNSYLPKLYSVRLKTAMAD